MQLDLEGKCAIVCAASKGLGRATALSLAREGARVAVCARSEPALAGAAAAIREATGAFVVPIAADVAIADDVDRLVERAAQELGAIDILITNTGGPKSAPFMAISDADWREAIDSLLMSVVRLSRAVIPHMRRRGGGRIINITSISAKQPVEGLVLSNALRAGITGLARTIANELAPENILVNCVAPGYTATDRVVELAEAAARREGITAEAVQQRTVARIPMQRMATTEEFADVVTFLASGRASYVTGTTLQVDGGYVRSLL
ncbi:MAG TPA: SDR family oxidoreductase [Vicinamibacterales bacterium]|nr:SDR family oxidoreductase [Vicinamibacterales bacterium]